MSTHLNKHGHVTISLDDESIVEADKAADALLAACTALIAKKASSNDAPPDRNAMIVSVAMQSCIRGAWRQGLSGNAIVAIGMVIASMLTDSVEKEQWLQAISGIAQVALNTAAQLADDPAPKADEAGLRGLRPMGRA